MKNRKEYKERRDLQDLFSFYDSLTPEQLKELRCDVNSRKLYGEKVLEGCGIRATVFERDGAYILTSFWTEVALIKDGKLYRIWDEWSATTAKHIKKFCEKYGVRNPSKYEWIMTNVGDPIKYAEVR